MKHWWPQAVALLLSLGIAGCSGEQKEASEPASLETVSIPLNESALREPLVNFVLPQRPDQKMQVRSQSDAEGAQTPYTTRDRVQFTGSGMLVTQPANETGPGRVTGLKLLVPATGDFELKLNCAVRRLDQPTESGMHGLAIRCVFGKGQTSLVLFGCMSSRNCDRCLVRRIKSPESPPQSVIPLAFEDGTWIVTRIGESMTLTVESKKGEVIASDKIDGIVGELEATEVWCTRLQKGNAHAEIELREISMSAPQLFPAEETPDSILPWIRWGFVALIVILSGIALRNRN